MQLQCKLGKLTDTHDNSSPIKMASDKVVNLVLGFGVKVLEFMHRTVEIITYADTPPSSRYSYEWSLACI